MGGPGSGGSPRHAQGLTSAPALGTAHARAARPGRHAHAAATATAWERPDARRLAPEGTPDIPHRLVAQPSGLRGAASHDDEQDRQCQAPSHRVPLKSLSMPHLAPPAPRWSADGPSLQPSQAGRSQRTGVHGGSTCGNNSVLPQHTDSTTILCSWDDVPATSQHFARSQRFADPQCLQCGYSIVCLYQEPASSVPLCSTGALAPPYAPRSLEPSRRPRVALQVCALLVRACLCHAPPRWSNISH